MRLATDTGGTFTDLAVERDDGSVELFKASTTPADPVKGVLDALTVAAQADGSTLSAFLAKADTFIHGTTHAINAIVTGETASTALLVTEGHRDILMLREGGRSEPFNNSEPYPKPYIPRSKTFGIPERILFNGDVHRALDEDVAIKTIQHLDGIGVQAIAICLLWSVVNPAHELRLAELVNIHAPHITVTLSHKVNPTLREYRRASSAAIDASLKPIMSQYIGGLKDRLAGAGFSGRVLILTSRGGMVDAEDVAETPIQVINSGPSVAPVAGRHYAHVQGVETAIVADTGGTTYDVGLVRDGLIPFTRDMWIGKPLRGHLVGFPSVDMKSVGAGGGSIAWIDEGGLLHVGPKSAGALPGPACYGRGGRKATVTDAACVLGFINPDYFLGGSISLDLEAAKTAVLDDVAKPLGISLMRAASAIIDLATENMAQAIIDITMEQGVDPATASLIGGGGAAGLNSVYIARRLGVKELLIPDTGATLSAVGALLSELTSEYADVCFASTREPDWSNITATVASLLTKCADFRTRAGRDVLSENTRVVAEARYENQVWEIEVPIDPDFVGEKDFRERFRESFDAQHKQLFSVEDKNSDVEIVGLRAGIRCQMRENTDFKMLPGPGQADRDRRRTVHFPGHDHATETPIRSLDSLPVDQVFRGPAVLESPLTTIVIDPDATYVKKRLGNLVIKP